MLQIHQNKPTCVPHFVGKSAVGLNFVTAKGNVGAWCGADSQGEAHRVGSEFRCHLQGIQDISLSLRHFLALSVTHQSVDVEFPERHLSHELQTQHDHPRAPEKQDVLAHDHQVIRVEALEVRCPSGQPSVANGQSAELNQVSSTSVSSLSALTWHREHFVGVSRAVITSPHPSQYQTGIRCPHQSCREIHQS